MLKHTFSYPAAIIFIEKGKVRNGVRRLQKTLEELQLIIRRLRAPLTV